MKCEKHQLKKDFIFCLENQCGQDRLACRKCYLVNGMHQNHSKINLDYFMESDVDELTRVFNESYVQTIKHDHNANQFWQILDARISKILDEREEMMRQPFEQMISQYRIAFCELKKQLYQKYAVDDLKTISQIQQSMKNLLDSEIQNQQKQKELKQQIVGLKNMINVQEQMDLIIKQVQQGDQQMFSQIQQAIDNQQTKQKQVFQSYIDNMQFIEQFQKCKNEVVIKHTDRMEKYKEMIQQHQQQNDCYRIEIDFYEKDTSLEFKMEVVDMLEQLNANHNVGTFILDLNDENIINHEFLVNIVNRYPNLYGIWLHNKLEQVDNSIHNQLKIIVQGSELRYFGLVFRGSPYDDDGDVLVLVKEYNQIMKDKKYLIQLWYKHNKVDKVTKIKKDIEQMIVDVTNI